MPKNLEECNDLLDKIHQHRLQFLGLIDMSREEAITKLNNLKLSTYESLKSSVNYHAKKPFLNLELRRTATVNRNSAHLVEETLPKIEPKVEEIPTTDYTSILDPDTDPNTVDSKYLTIREEYLQELRDMVNKGGCSSCQRGKLRRKYIEKLTDLDKSNSES
jgi:hypothetical protein